MSATYTPKNQYVFFQALSGAVAGILGQQTSLPTTQGSYTQTIVIASAWAQAVDTAWDSSENPDAFEYETILAFSSDLFQISNLQGNPASVTSSSYTRVANALSTILEDGEAYLLAAGIPVPPLFPQSTVITSVMTIVVDPIHGDDNNPGTVAEPFATVARLNAALQNVQIAAPLTILMGFGYSSEEDEVFAPQGVNIFGAGYIQIGPLSQTVTHSGTLTSGTTPINPSAQQRQVVADTSGPGWTLYSRVQDTTNGGGAYVMRTLGGETADTTQPCTVDGDAVTMVSSHSYQVISNPAIGMGLIDVQCNGEDAGIIVEDLDIVGFPTVMAGSFTSFERCRFLDTFSFLSAGYDGASVFDCLLLGGLVGATFSGSGPLSIYFGGAVVSGSESSGSLELSNNAYVTGLALVNQPQITISPTGAQFQDLSYSPAGLIATGLVSIVGLLWGNGNAAYGMAVEGQAAVVTNTSVPPTVTGSSGDLAFQQAGGTYAATAFPWIAGSAAYGPSEAITWLNYESTFLGSAANPATGARVYAGH
jgi:hypothetical protein